MDAVFVRGMLNNPDIQPNAVINRWIAAVLLFDFKLVHVPAAKHHGPDGLSRCEPVDSEDDDEDDAEEWIDHVLGLGIWATFISTTLPRFLTHSPLFLLLSAETNPSDSLAPPINFPVNAKSLKAEAKLMKIQDYLETGEKPVDMIEEDWEKVFRKTKHYILLDR